MIKLQEQVPISDEHYLVKDLMRRIKIKLMDFGYSNGEIHKEMMNVVNKVLKVRANEAKELKKVLTSRLTSDKISKKLMYQLIIELDLYLNCIEDNYDEPSEQIVKIQHSQVEVVEPPKRQSQILLKTQDLFDDFGEMSLYESMRRPSLFRDFFGQAHRPKRFVSRLSSSREVKLEEFIDCGQEL